MCEVVIGDGEDRREITQKMAMGKIRTRENTPAIEDGEGSKGDNTLPSNKETKTTTKQPSYVSYIRISIPPHV